MSQHLPQPCDLLIEAGHVVPVQPHALVLPDSSVAVHDGVIVGIGPREQMRAQ